MNPRAKVNLALGVVGRRPDGFHELVSVFVRVDLADRLTVRTLGLPATLDPAADRLHVSGAQGLTPDSDNLVLRAARLLRAWAARPLEPLAFDLEKRIPIAAGLGGGSADAAAALALAAQAWGLPLTAGERRHLAARLGSDVPFFAAGAAVALVRGRGEEVEPLPPPVGAPGFLLATDPHGLATADVFGALAAAGGLPGPDAPATRDALALAEALRAGLDGRGLASWAQRLRDANDLWPPAATLRPSLVGLRRALEERLGRPLLLSGSGPTLLALYPLLDEARTAASAIATRPVAGHEAARVRAAGLGRDEE
jgi:4-diphosphocytidyl-2-C-methyl-D-erythritol kinase